MNTTDFNNIPELEEMRSQLHLLKEQVSQQKIVSDEMMRKITSKRITKINREGRISIFISIVIMPFIAINLYHMGVSLPFTIVTILFMLVAASFSFYSRIGINPEAVINGNLVETHKKMLRYKLLCNRWLLGVIPFLVIWFCWFLLELIGVNNDFSQGAIMGGCVGAVIGTICGTIYYKKSQANLNSAIEEINELIKE